MDAKKMIRKQIYLEPKQNEQIKILSARKEKTEAEIIRDAVNDYLTDKEQELEDPLLELIGMAGVQDRHGSIMHDRVIYLAKKENENPDEEK